MEGALLGFVWFSLCKRVNLSFINALFSSLCSHPEHQPPQGVSKGPVPAGAGEKAGAEPGITNFKPWNKTCARAHTPAGWEGDSIWRSKASDHWDHPGAGNKATEFTETRKIKVCVCGKCPEQLDKPNSE